jgi:hypothetical protein
MSNRKEKTSSKTGKSQDPSLDTTAMTKTTENRPPQSALRLLAGLAMATLTLAPTASNADSSPCTGRIQAMGYAIRDIDSDFYKSYDEFDVIKDQNLYELKVDRKTCKIINRQHDY